MSCILRISGESLDVESLLSKHSLPTDRMWKKGEQRSLKGKKHSDSGVNFIASEADFDEFNQQVEDATAYFQAHESIIAMIVAFPGVDYAVLDFGVSLYKDSFVKFCYLPPQLIKLAASTGIGVEISCYACSDEDDES